MTATRPLYENTQTLAIENAAREVVEQHLGGRLVKLPIAYRVDYAHCAGPAIRGWVELKCRTHEHDRYPTFFVSLGKIMAGVDLEVRTGLPFRLFVGFADGLYSLSPGFGYDSIGIGGRTDRHDAQDIEPVAHFNIARLSRL